MRARWTPNLRGYRKVGVGFNHPRVLDGKMQFDWRQRWDFTRRLTRMGRPCPPHQRIGASAVEVSGRIMVDMIRRPKR